MKNENPPTSALRYFLLYDTSLYPSRQQLWCMKSTQLCGPLYHFSARATTSPAVFNVLALSHPMTPHSYIGLKSPAHKKQPRDAQTVYSIIITPSIKIPYKFLWAYGTAMTPTYYLLSWEDLQPQVHLCSSLHLF